jgi:hypothetical protein
MNVRFSKRKPKVKTFRKPKPPPTKSSGSFPAGEYKIPRSKTKGTIDLNVKISIVLAKTNPHRVYITYSDPDNISDSSRIFINDIPPTRALPKKAPLTWRDFVRYPYEGFENIWILRDTG